MKNSNRMLAVPVTMLLVLAACAAPGATSGSGEPGSRDSDLEASQMISQDLRMTLSAGDGPQQAGAPIDLVLTVTNDGASAVDLDFSNGQRYDFQVFSEDGGSVWHWGDGMAFTMMLGRETIDPSGTLRWTETIADGLPAGSYRVLATLTTANRPTVEITLTVPG